MNGTQGYSTILLVEQHGTYYGTCDEAARRLHAGRPPIEFIPPAEYTAIEYAIPIEAWTSIQRSRRIPLNLLLGHRKRLWSWWRSVLSCYVSSGRSERKRGRQVRRSREDQPRPCPCRPRRSPSRQAMSPLPIFLFAPDVRCVMLFLEFQELMGKWARSWSWEPQAHNGSTIRPIAGRPGRFMTMWLSRFLSRNGSSCPVTLAERCPRGMDRNSADWRWRRSPRISNNRLIQDRLSEPACRGSSRPS